MCETNEFLQHRGAEYLARIVPVAPLSCEWPDKKYCILAGYNHRESVPNLDETSTTDEYQDNVYNLAVGIAKERNCKKVLDIGTGSAFKLFKYFPPTEGYLIGGTDVEPAISFLRQKYPENKWYTSDFLGPSPMADIVLAVDIIEHLPDPEAFLKWVAAGEWEVLVISTVDRDVVLSGIGIAGPPNNPYHFREWNA